jgi:hypothetical protein
MSRLELIDHLFYNIIIRSKILVIRRTMKSFQANLFSHQNLSPSSSWLIFVSIRSAERILRHRRIGGTGRAAASRAIIPAKIHFVCADRTNGWRTDRCNGFRNQQFLDPFPG